MDKKQKNKRLEIRVSEEEYNEYKNAAQKLTLSDWARCCLACRTVYVDYAPQMLEVVADLQTCLNKAMRYMDVEENIEKAYKETGKLWQYLKR